MMLLGALSTSCEDAQIRKSSPNRSASTAPQDAVPEGNVLTVVIGGAVRLDNTVVYFEPNASRSDIRVRLKRVEADITTSSAESQTLLGNASGETVLIEIVDAASGNTISADELLKPFKFEQTLDLENSESPLSGVIGQNLGEASESLEVVDSSEI